MWNDLLDLTYVESIWAQASEIDSVMLETLFIAANEMCVAYAPALDPLAPVPSRYLLAEIFMAQHLWNAARGDRNSEFGDDLNVPSYPLVFQARDLLRPKTSPLGKLGL